LPFLAWKDFLTSTTQTIRCTHNFRFVDGKPIVYSNQKTADKYKPLRQWSRKIHFPSLADILAQWNSPPENVVFVEDGEEVEFFKQFSSKGKDLHRFKTALESAQFFTSRVYRSYGKWRKRPKESQNLRVWPSNEPKYTVICKGGGVVLELFFRSWKSNGIEGPCKELYTYGDVEEVRTPDIHRIFRGEEYNITVACLMKKLEHELFSIMQAHDLTTQYATATECDTDTMNRNRSSSGSVQAAHSPPADTLRRTNNPPRFLQWRPRGLAPPKAIPRPFWKEASRTVLQSRWSTGSSSKPSKAIAAIRHTRETAEDIEQPHTEPSMVCSHSSASPSSDPRRAITEVTNLLHMTFRIYSLCVLIRILGTLFLRLLF